MTVLGAPVHQGCNLAFFVAIFSEMVLEEKQFREQVYAAVMKPAGETGKANLCPILFEDDGK